MALLLLNALGMLRDMTIDDLRDFGVDSFGYGFK